MAGRGPAPKNPKADFTELQDSGKKHGKPLPKGVLPDGEQWHPQTVKWWDALRRYPMLEHEPEIGWQFLLDTALMHHTMWTKGRWEFAGELRLRVAKYGATPEDRQRLKVTVATSPKPQTAAGGDSDNVSSISSRRGRLTG